MKTDDILKKCIELPGMALKKSHDSVELVMQHTDGKGRMIFYTLFPGVLLAYIHVNSPIWPAPDMSSDAPNGRGPLLLNYCIAGRCEILLNNDNYVYLKDDELSLSECFAQEQYIYPRRIYEGIELFIDLETVKTDSAFLEDEFQLDLSELPKKYCSDGKTYLAPCDSEVKASLQRIWSLCADNSSVALLRRKAEAINVLGLLSCKDNLSESRLCTFFTPTQVDIAKRVEKIITEDLRQHHPVWEIAEQFSVSVTSIKNYFRGVYGQNISTYLRDIRMNTAAQMLLTDNLSVADIAEHVGYLNQSKFSSAFKRHFGVSPLEYKRTKRLDLHISLDKPDQGEIKTLLMKNTGE